MIAIGSIVINCFEFEKMVAFWKEALNYRPREKPSADWAVLTDPERRGPNLSFQKRDHPRDRRSWLHLDLYTDNHLAETARLIALGAKQYPWNYPPGADYTVLEDPDGNLFCVIARSPERAV